MKLGGEDGWKALNEAAGVAPGQMGQFFGNGTPVCATAALNMSGPRH